MEKVDDITKLKAEIFDIIFQQEQLNFQIKKLEELKIEKLKELQKLQNGKKEDK